jgi:hypothetical protein
MGEIVPALKVRFCTLLRRGQRLTGEHCRLETADAGVSVQSRSAGSVPRTIEQALPDRSRVAYVAARIVRGGYVGGLGKNGVRSLET